MAKGKAKKFKTKASGKAVRGSHEPPRKPRIPAVIDAYSGSGFHTPGKYGTKERREARRDIDRQRD